MTNSSRGTEPSIAGGKGARPFLDVRDLKVHFGTRDGVVRSVDGIGFTLDRGKTLGVVGESGSGKSVSGQAILGLHRSGGAVMTSGNIFLDGQDLMSLTEEAMRRLRGDRVAMIFQDPLSAFHPYYTIGWQIIEAIRVHRDHSLKFCRERATEMLELVGIPDPRRRMDQYPHEFSGGMCQRAMIAMALINEPELLIADEPTTALDVTVQAQILELLQDLQRELGTAIIIVTHDLGVVADIADEALVMYAGRVVERGTISEIFRAPEHPYTWGLLRSMPRTDLPPQARLTPIRGYPPSLINVPSGCPFHPRCDYPKYVGDDKCRLLEPALEPTSSPPSSGHALRCHLPNDKRRELALAEMQRRRPDGRQHGDGRT
jgi:peptide/nickel transport system ATP-binding protein